MEEVKYFKELSACSVSQWLRKEDTAPRTIALEIQDLLIEGNWVKKKSNHSFIPSDRTICFHHKSQ